MQTINLPTPIVSGLVYDRVAVDRVMPNDTTKVWTFLVYGIPAGSDQPMPLVVQTLHRGVVRVEQMTVTYASLPEGVTAANLPAAITTAAFAQLQDLMTSEPPAPTPEAEA